MIFINSTINLFSDLALDWDEIPIEYYSHYTAVEVISQCNKKN